MNAVATQSRFVVRFSDHTERECNARCPMQAIITASCQQILAQGSPLIEHVDQVGVGRVMTGPLHLMVNKLPPTPHERRWTCAGDIVCASVTAMLAFGLLALGVFFSWFVAGIVLLVISFAAWPTKVG